MVDKVHQIELAKIGAQGTDALKLARGSLKNQAIITQVNNTSLPFYQPIAKELEYFESAIFLYPNLLYLLRQNPGAVIPYIFNKALLAVIKANPSLINMLLSKGSAAFRLTHSVALLEELVSNPKLLAALRSNPSLQMARRMLAGYMPDSHYLINDSVNKKHLALVAKLFQEEIFAAKTLDTNNLLIRAWRTKFNADVARGKVLQAAQQSGASRFAYTRKPVEAPKILYGHSIEDEVIAKALKYHHEQIVTSPKAPQVQAKALKAPPMQQFYDPGKFPNTNPAYLAFAGSGGMIAARGKKLGDEEEPYVEEHPYKENFAKNDEVHKVVEVILSKLLSGTY